MIVGYWTEKVLLLGALGLMTMICFCCGVFWAPLPRPVNPPETFREEDLVGIWKADYGDESWRACDTRLIIDEEALREAWQDRDYSRMEEVLRQGVVKVEEIVEARSLVEWLVLREDRTFYQVLQDRAGKIPDQQARGTWWVERFPDGATRLHLEGGRAFAAAVCYSYPTLDVGGGHYSSDQTGHELDFDAGKAVIIVGWNKRAQELYLEYPLVGDPDAPVIVKFKRVPDSEADSVPTPAP